MVSGIVRHSYCWLRSCGSKPASRIACLNCFIRKTMRRTGSTHHIFFDHDRSKIIGTGMQTQLCCLFTNRKPDACMFLTLGSMMRLMSNHANIFFRRSRLCTPRIFASNVSTSWKVHGIKAEILLHLWFLCLHIADFYQMLKTFLNCFHMTKHHRGRCCNIQFVRFVHNGQPFIGTTFSFLRSVV